MNKIRSISTHCHLGKQKPQRTAPNLPKRLVHSGLTLLEVMLAMFVLVTIFAAALTSVVSAAKLTTAAKNRTRAVAILNQRMEEMRAVTFANLKTNMATTAFTQGDEVNNDISGKNSYSYHWTRELVTSDEDGASIDSTKLVKIKVTVQWRVSNRFSSISSFSYYSIHGVSNKASS